MAPPVNEPGHPLDVTALIVTKETDVTTVLRGSKEMTVTNALMVTMATHVVSSLSFHVLFASTQETFFRFATCLQL